MVRKVTTVLQMFEWSNKCEEELNEDDSESLFKHI